jgi:hypothetical protein
MSTPEEETSQRGLAPSVAHELAAEMAAVARVLLGSALGDPSTGHVVAGSEPGPVEVVVPAVLEVPPGNVALVVEATDLSLQTHSTPVPVPLPTALPVALPAAPLEPRDQALPELPEPVAIPVPGFGGRARTTELLEEIGFLDD